MKAFISACVVVFLPAVALAQIDNSALQCDPLRPTYWPRGDRWTPTAPLASSAKNRPLGLYFQPDGPIQSPSLSMTTVRAAVMASFGKWASVDCGSGAHPDLAFQDLGTYATRDGGDNVEANQFKNVVYWVETAANWRGDQATVALTWNLALPTFAVDAERSTGGLLDADMELNGVNFNWRVRSGSTVSGCTAGTSDCFDVGSVALHEAGHFLGFNHVQCADAVMFPTGSGTGEVTALSAHEQEGVCRLYPPRPTSASGTVPLTYEQCDPAATTPCAGDDVCIQSEDYKVTYPLAWCATPCLDTADCPTAYICREQYVTGDTYCSPGVNFEGGVGDGGTAPPGGGLAMCGACTSGDQCVSGLCVGDGTAHSICTDRCISSAASTGCPTGFDCLATDDGMEICWPQGGPDACATTEPPADTSQLNELCYQVGYDDGGTKFSEWFQTCGAGLICVAFKARGFVYNDACATLQEGACVLYCSPDRPCPSVDGSGTVSSQLTCCYGLDAAGQCLGASVSEGRVHGGCFDLRQEGETCVGAEESVCEPGTGCYTFGDAAASRCYRECPLGSECDPSQTCAGPYQAVCAQATFSLCDPLAEAVLAPLGLGCTRSTECDSGLCQRHSDDAACSRSCDLVTGAGCPGNVDIDGDGALDGGFECLALATNGAGRCWPRNGPVHPDGGTTTDIPPSTGCCSAVGTPVRVGDILLGALAWLPLVRVWRRRRRG